MFHSIQLNVNNPHFLIMQGRIAKIVSHKPADTLAMVEEAAGTKMYEGKKAVAEKKLLGKEQKLQDIERAMKETVRPEI